MSSNAERVPNAGAQVQAEGQVIDFLLGEIGKRAPSPTQAVRVCQILNLAARENIRRVREIAKNKTVPEAENKKPEEKEMEIIWGKAHRLELQDKIARAVAERFVKKLQKIIAKKKLILDVCVEKSPGGDVKVAVYLPASGKGMSFHGERGYWYPGRSKIWTEFVHDRSYAEDIKKGKYNLLIHVEDKTYFRLARSFALNVEKNSKGSSRPRQVVICKEFVK